MRRWPAILLCSLGVAGLIVSVSLWRTAIARNADWTALNVNGMRYDVLLPANYSSSIRYPVVLYLHQLAMGNYPNGLLKQVGQWFDNDVFRSSHPCIIVVPMLDQTNDPGGRIINFGGKQAGHEGEDNAIAALKQVMDRDSVDPSRIYVTGNSMGGMGTWQMLLDYNAQTGGKGHIFAAGLPLAGRHGTADPAAAAQSLRNVPIWSIHGAADKEVGLEWDRTMARLLSGSDTFRYTEAPGLGHDVWDTYYQRADVWDWLFAQASKA